MRKHHISAFLWGVSDRLGRQFGGEECRLPPPEDCASVLAPLFANLEKSLPQLASVWKCKTNTGLCLQGCGGLFKKMMVLGTQRHRHHCCHVSSHWSVITNVQMSVWLRERSVRYLGAQPPSNRALCPGTSARTMCHYWTLHISFSKIFSINIKTCLGSCQLFTWHESRTTRELLWARP